MDSVLKRLKELTDEDSRYAYADTVANAFLIGQIKALQKARGLTQDELAERVHTKQSGISRWMNSGFSTCKIESLRKFARAYGVRLRISFEPFGTLPGDIVGFIEERLSPPRWEDDPALAERESRDAGGAPTLNPTNMENAPVVESETFQSAITANVVPRNRPKRSGRSKRSGRIA